MSQRQDDITPEGSSSGLCLPGAKKSWTMHGPESSWAWSQAAEPPVRKVASTGLGCLRRERATYETRLLVSTSDAHHTLGEELHVSPLERPAHRPWDVKTPRPISQTRL